MLKSFTFLLHDPHNTTDFVPKEYIQISTHLTNKRAT